MSRVDQNSRSGSPVPASPSATGSTGASPPPTRPAEGGAGSTGRPSDGLDLLRSVFPGLDDMFNVVKEGLTSVARGSSAPSVPASSVVLPPPAAGSPTASQIGRNREAIAVSTKTEAGKTHAPWDINRYAPKNTGEKTSAFRGLVDAEKQLDKAVTGEKQAREALHKAQQQHATAPSARTAKNLEAAQNKLEAATGTRTKEEGELGQAEQRLRAEMKRQSPGKSAEIDALNLRNRPINEDTHTVQVGGKTVVLNNSVEAAAAVDASGLVTPPNKQGRATVQAAVDRSGFSESAKNVLKGTSANEGAFDTINGWDSKGITFGFIQMAGGKAGDTLPSFLAQLKKDDSRAFAETLQKYGIDVERTGKGPELVVRQPDGTVLRGADAAKKIGTDPKLAAALSAAGQHPDVQQAQLRFAKDYLDSQRRLEIEVDGQKVKISDLITSEYGNGILFDRSVHGGKAGARATLDRVATEYLAKHPGAKLSDESTRAAIETAYIAEVNQSKDLKGRNANIASRTSSARGSYVE